MRAKQEIRRAHAGGDGGEHRSDDQWGLRERKAHRGPEKRRGAGGGQRGREQTLKERASFAFARRGVQHPMHQGLRQRDLENAEEIERENENDDAESQYEIRVRELRGPCNLMTGRFQRDE